MLKQTPIWCNPKTAFDLFISRRKKAARMQILGLYEGFGYRQTAKGAKLKGFINLLIPGGTHRLQPIDEIKAVLEEPNGSAVIIIKTAKWNYGYNVCDTYLEVLDKILEAMK